jgi:NlpC/P60 family putative phage cell wall peptidase
MTLRADDIVTAARGWIGTPYRHQASLKGAGCDCLGLVRGVWRECIGPEPETAPPYAPDWAEAGGRETLAEAAGRWLRPIAIEAASGGDVVLFRWRDGVAAKHAGLLSGEGRFIHAYEGTAVVESTLGPWWRRRISHAFRFPGLG